jgi:hypothetical protein
LCGIETGLEMHIADHALGYQQTQRHHERISE